MKAQDVILGARVAHVRELKSEIARLKAEVARLGAENEELRTHFSLVLLAAEDMRRLPEGGRLVVVDGWSGVRRQYYPQGERKSSGPPRAYDRGRPAWNVVYLALSNFLGSLNSRFPYYTCLR